MSEECGSGSYEIVNMGSISEEQKGHKLINPSKSVKKFLLLAISNGETGKVIKTLQRLDMRGADADFWKEICLTMAKTPNTHLNQALFSGKWQDKTLEVIKQTISAYILINEALKAENYELAKRLCQTIGVNSRGGEYLWSVLHYTLAYNNNPFKAIKFLIEIGADPNIKNYEEDTPLHFAALVGNIEIIDFLFQNGAKAVKNKNGEVPNDWLYEENSKRILNNILNPLLIFSLLKK